jgi:hypothetical protein
MRMISSPETYLLGSTGFPRRWIMQYCLSITRSGSFDGPHNPSLRPQKYKCPLNRYGHLAPLAKARGAVLATLDRKIPAAFVIPPTHEDETAHAS